MKKEIINSKHAPSPIGPYNQAVEMNGMLFISGQIALIPETDTIMMDSIEQETEQVMTNLKAILTEAGMTFENVLKSTIFLSNMNMFTKVNEVYANCLGDHFPARETVAVAGLPRGVNVEISMIAGRN